MLSLFNSIIRYTSLSALSDILQYVNGIVTANTPWCCRKSWYCSVLNLMYWTNLCYLAVASAKGKYAHMLFNELFEDYSNALRPVEDTDKVLNVTLQITLSQIKDMVRVQFCFSKDVQKSTSCKTFAWKISLHFVVTTSSRGSCSPVLHLIATLRLPL